MSFTFYIRQYRRYDRTYNILIYQQRRYSFMLKQIFKQNVPIDILMDLLEKTCLKSDTYYLVNHNSFRKMIFHEYHIAFLDTIKEYYHISKQFYITRKLTYNSFTNIIRQICKSNNIMFTSQIKYNESKYNIDYFVYHHQCKCFEYHCSE